MTQVLIEKQPYLGDYDVVIIGAGIVGSMIARELSKFEGRFALLDKEAFCGYGVSKAGLPQIHSPDFFCPPGTLKGKLCVDAPARFKKLANELDVIYRETDELWLALEPSHIANLETQKKVAEEYYGATGFEMIGPEKIRELEPYVTKRALGALYVKGLGVIYSPEWTFALTENAVQNGVHLHLKTTVMDIKKEEDFAYVVLTQKGYFKTRYIINAAGLFSDEIAWMVGDRDIRLILRRGTMLIFDKSVSHLVRHMILGTFSERHSQDIAPTSHGNLILGIHYIKPEHKGDTKVSSEGIREVMKLGKELVPALSESDIITSFSGVIADNNMKRNGDFYIAHSEHAPGVIHTIIGAPGLTAAPGIAELVIKMLLDAGMDMEEKKTFQKKRIGWPQFSTASPNEQRKMIASNPQYGHIICRCEQVTEAEILEAIRRGADTLDAVKHLTRAGMGRCQGGFCGTFVLNLLAKQLGISPTQVTKNGEGSHQIIGFTKERCGFTEGVKI